MRRAGDVDGDGYDDFVITTCNNNAYVVFGPTTGAVITSGSTTIDGLGGPSIGGSADVDGDGYMDILLGDSYDDSLGHNAGGAYLMMGPLTADTDSSSATVSLFGEDEDDRGGYSVDLVDDADGRGTVGLLIGAEGADDGGAEVGAAYLVMGPTSGEVSLSSANAKLLGEKDGDRAGENVCNAGDTDGDGFPDLLIGGLRDTYLVLGPVTGTVDLTTADTHIEEGHCIPGVLSGGVDADGDGLSDILINSYLFCRPASGTVSTDDANATFAGGARNAFPGDINADGQQDFLFGNWEDDTAGNKAGAAWLVLGPATGTLALDSDAAAKLLGEAADDYASSVSGAGDNDADGWPDYLVGAIYEDSADPDSGAVYLLLGGYP